VRLVLPKLIARNAFLASILKMEYALIVPLDVKYVIPKLIAHSAILGIILRMEYVKKTLRTVRCSLKELVVNAINFISLRMGYVDVVHLTAMPVYLRQNA